MRLTSLTTVCPFLALVALAGGAFEALGAPAGPVAAFHPVIVVEATYPGASAEVVAEKVAAPIEKQVNGVVHQAHLMSRCTNDGHYTLLVGFDSTVDLDMSQVLVQNRVSLALPEIPAVVQNEGVVVRKVAPGASMIVVLISPDASKDAVYLGTLASIQLRDELSRLPGVGRVSVLGVDEPCLSVWLDPNRLKAFNLSAGEAFKALREREAPKLKDQKEQPVHLRVADIVVKSNADGEQLRLRDLARVDFGRGPTHVEVSFDGRPAAALAIFPIPSVKPRDVSTAVCERMEILKKRFPPGVDYLVPLDLAPKGFLSRLASPRCLLFEPILAPATSANRIAECQNRYADILRRTRGVAHVLTLPENPWARFNGGSCVAALFNSDFKDANWEKTREAIRKQLLEEVRAAVPRMRDLSGPAGPRLDGYPVDFAIRGTDAKAVREFGEALAEKLKQTGKLLDIETGPKIMPRIEIEIDRARAAALGVSERDVSEVLQVALGSANVKSPDQFAPFFRLQVKLDAPAGDEVAVAKQLQVRSAKGELVSVSSIVSFKEGLAASLERVDLLPATTISANPATGVSLAEARWLCETVADQLRKDRKLPAGFELVWLQEVPAPKPIQGEPKTEPTASLVQVTVALPVIRSVAEFEEFTGRLDAAQSVELRPRVTGYLEKVYVKDGADVKKGDALFAIDAKPYQAALDLAQAKLREAEAQRDLSKVKLARMRSPAEIDAAQSEVQIAVARLEAAQAVVASARLNVDWCTIRAPIDGRMGRRYLDPGNLIKGDSTTLAALVNVDTINVCFDVDERTVLRLARLAREAKAKDAVDAQTHILFGLADETGYPFSAACDFVDNQINAATGTLLMRASLPNKERMLWPGQFVKVRLPIGDPYPALLVPDEAIGAEMGQKFVYVVDDSNKVVSRIVTVGAKYDGMRVVAKGLRPNDRVIVEGNMQVRPGQTVKLKPVIDDGKGKK